MADADPGLRREVWSQLLAQDTSREGILDRPAADLLNSSSAPDVGHFKTQLEPQDREAPSAA